jgi:lipopolysaccharide/colanic/teichoic acid biosynthesis glycosyltransferase
MSRSVYPLRAAPLNLVGSANAAISPCALGRPLPALAKRCFDLVFATVAALLLALPLLVLVIAIWLESPANPFFIQERLGLRGKPFRLIKLRTMVPDAEQRRAEVEHLNESKPPLFKARNDPRLTRVGRVLRSTSLDELPQILNVIRGEMSIVGPRPRLPQEFAEVMDRPDIIRRLQVKPGLAGVWQVSGRAHNDFDRALALDLYYIDHWSFWFDLKLIARTFWVVVSARGAF